ncbi:MAG TPA: TdeIII family type II restriction endonuclease [Anaerolineaceae bacterium]|jgi:type II restriction enzyme|nr:TdeIII family type II restriction endonuclease [Anaerolineaceae bacterium]HQF45834.1 TdeIII family type II restriction endonuclease [Anaerolineaceae bacterium]HQH35204.1 TdeIII family type II restriction endonuclease [Anaerolineaceae bacterium]HQJ03590.1 TdeIII family type II restriction endonuclease [Anaerolineaceae bacterium]HQO98877.1 TdeIII family type II restriction endonuclease [Anaerolineaceae bacterium]
MPLSKHQIDEIIDLLVTQIRRKLETYNPETNSMPFHTRLLGKDRMALYSFIQSINTTLGTSVFEQVAVLIGTPRFQRIERQYTIGTQMSSSAQSLIQDLMDGLRTSAIKPDKSRETIDILNVSGEGNSRSVKATRVDLFIIDEHGTEYYIDIKTAKPNIGDFVGYKRTLLEWIALRGYVSQTTSIKTLLAIPYNPYEPQPYQRWTLQGLFDVANEILVAEEFWNFLGGPGTYQDTLDGFEKAGILLKPEIDRKFSEFA